MRHKESHDQENELKSGEDMGGSEEWTVPCIPRHKLRPDKEASSFIIRASREPEGEYHGSLAAFVSLVAQGNAFRIKQLEQPSAIILGERLIGVRSFSHH